MTKDEKVAGFRKRAVEARSKAALVNAPDMEQAFLRIAEEWDRTADAVAVGYDG
jgi:hypothetical protein